MNPKTYLRNSVYVAQGSLPGAHHRLSWRNNQDAVATVERPGLWCGVVSDGCGSGAFSELGARLVVQATTQWALAANLDDNGGDARRWADDCCTNVVERLRVVLPHRLPLDGDAAFIRDHLLATLLVAVVTSERAAVFGIGDGVVVVDGDAKVIAPNAGNAPNYLAYRLLDVDHAAHDDVAPVVHLDADVELVHQLWLGTDGAEALLDHDDDVLEDGRARGGLATWADADDKVWRNPSVLQKRLRRLAQNHLLDDDTSVVGWCRRREERGTP